MNDLMHFFLFSPLHNLVQFITREYCKCKVIITYAIGKVMGPQFTKKCKKIQKSERSKFKRKGEIFNLVATLFTWNQLLLFSLIHPNVCELLYELHTHSIFKSLTLSFTNPNQQSRNCNILLELACHQCKKCVHVSLCKFCDGGRHANDVVREDDALPGRVLMFDKVGVRREKRSERRDRREKLLKFFIF